MIILSTLDNSMTINPEKINFIAYEFEQQVKYYANGLAIKSRNKKITYDELNRAANQLAHYLLLTQNFIKGDIVAVCMKKSIDVVIIFLACLKAGLVFLPINFRLPIRIIDHILKETNASILFTSGRVGQELNDKLTIAPTFFEHIKKTSEKYSGDNLECEYQKEDLAYIIYTSGTTGFPKGVMVSHSNIASILPAWKKAYKLKKGFNHLQLANYFFDVFLGDIVRALCTGGSLILCPMPYLLQPRKLYQLILRENITCAEFVPLVLRRLVRYVVKHQLSLDSLKLLVCGSDHWYWEEYLTLKKLCSPSTRVINSYGMTEATIDSTFYEMKSADLLTNNISVPVGRPFLNTEVHVLDEKLKRTEKGAVGEVYISEGGVSLGYVGQPKLTQEKFIELVLDKKTKRLYRTGDLGFIDEQGNLHLVDRTDTQVKLNGQRIDLLQIEHALMQHTNIQECLVRLQKPLRHKAYLEAYLVLNNNNKKLTTRELTMFLKNLLPTNMMPKKYRIIQALPMNANGKLDRTTKLKGYLLSSDRPKIKGERLNNLNHTA